MSTEENKAAIRRYIDEAWNKGNVNIIDEVMAPDYIRYMNEPGKSLNREGQKQRILGFRKAFPDLHLAIEDMVAEGDKVSFRMFMRGTHQGTIMGIDPTGREITLSAIDIARFADGKIVEQWGQMDTLGLLQQLGAIPTPG